MTNLQQVLLNTQLMRLGMFFSRHTPERIGHRLAWWAAGVACQLKPAIHRIVQANLSQVLDADVGKETLAQMTRQVFYTAVRSYYDLFRALRLPLEELSATVDVSEAAKAVAHSLRIAERGTVLVFPHLSNFDLGGQATSYLLPETQLITLPDPSPGFQLLNELRRRTGIKVTPLSSAALRQALRLLRRGGIVTLGGDRPVSDLDDLVPFFGRPARMPSGHIRLALKTNANVAVGYCVLLPQTQKYTMHITPPMELLRTRNRDEEMFLNLRQVLDALEDIIRRWPEQWLMFEPVWPELLKT
jgi:lauroyl/myristoyl acyltransferase